MVAGVVHAGTRFSCRCASAACRLGGVTPTVGIHWLIVVRRLSLLVLTAAAGCWAGPPKITFTRDVAPLLQKNCQICHRPGEAAPFSMMSYKETRPWAKAIREAVLTRKMPPWFADPHYGKFSNDRSLSPSEIDT